MANRIKELKTRALEISKTSGELKEQKKINMNDLSIKDELLSIRFEDESAESEVNSVSKAVADEHNLISERIGENLKNIDETSSEADDYINSLKSNRRKMERMRATSNLVDVGRQTGETGRRIKETEGVKQTLKRIAAGIGAIVELPAGAVLPLQNQTEKNSVPIDVPAIYKYVDVDVPTNDRELLQSIQRRYPDYKFTFESAPEEKPRSVEQKIGETGQNVHDVMSEVADEIERKRKRKE